MCPGFHTGGLGSLPPQDFNVIIQGLKMVRTQTLGSQQSCQNPPNSISGQVLSGEGGGGGGMPPDPPRWMFAIP